MQMKLNQQSNAVVKVLSSSKFWPFVVFGSIYIWVQNVDMGSIWLFSVKWKKNTTTPPQKKEKKNSNPMTIDFGIHDKKGKQRKQC